MKKIFLLYVLLMAGFPPTALFAQTRELAVTVLDLELNSPLEGVKLKVSGSQDIFITDSQGKAVVKISNTQELQLLTAEIPGYQIKKMPIEPGDSALLIKLQLLGSTGSGELVVEKSKPKQTDEQAIVSQVMTNDDLKKNTMGIIEDVMTMVKVLPGVGYTGTFDSRPSIQGGNPDDLLATLDGAYVLFPYHWGGLCSIFNPNMVESAKLSMGIISATYSQVMSGMLEVTTIDPLPGQKTVDIGLSTCSGDAFISLPLSDNAGFFSGGKATWLQLPFSLLLPGTTAPYIYEAFAKLYWKPTPRIYWFINCYIGTDGLGMTNTTSDSSINSISTTDSFDYYYTQILLTTGAKFLLSDTLFLNLLASYNSLELGVKMDQLYNGTQDYDAAFMAANAGILGGAAGFTLNNLAFHNKNTTKDYLYQAKADLDWELSPANILSLGIEGLLETQNTDQTFNGYSEFFVGITPTFANVSAEISTNGNKTLLLGSYLNYDFSFFQGVLTGELGVRGDYAVVYTDDWTLLMNPSLSPRLRLDFTPIKNQGDINSLSFIVGTGLFSKMVVLNPLIDKKNGISDYQFGPERGWFSELGAELKLNGGWKLFVDGYYKYYFDRFYFTTDPLVTPAPFTVYGNGTGYSWGADLMIQKKDRFWDASISYSCMVTKLFNPGNNSGPTTDLDGNPLNAWFSPNYNIEHTINLVVTFSPTDDFSITVQGTIASGRPMPKVGSIYSYPVLLPDGTYAERFTSTTEYSDGLRTGWSFPVNIKLSWHGFWGQSKAYWEFYLAAQDVLSFLYYKGAQGNPPFDPWTGKDLSGSAEPTFGAGIPIPSFGYRINF